MKLTIRLPFGCRLSSAPEFVIVFVACFSFSLTKFRFITILCKMKWNLLACGIRKWFLLIDGSIDTGLCTLTNQWREKTPNNVEFWRKYRKQYEQIHGCVRCVCVCACLSLWNGIIIIFWFHRQTQPYKSQVFFSFRLLWRSFPSCGIVNVNCDRGEFWRTRARVSVYVWCNVEAPMKKQSIIARYFGICGVKSKGISCVYCVHTAPQPFKWWTWTV